MKINLFQKFVFDENIDSQKDNLFLKNIFFSKNDFFKKFLLVPLPFFYFLNIYQTNTPFIKFKFNNIKYLKYLNLLKEKRNIIRFKINPFFKNFYLSNLNVFFKFISTYNFFFNTIYLDIFYFFKNKKKKIKAYSF